MILKRKAEYLINKILRNTSIQSREISNTAIERLKIDGFVQFENFIAEKELQEIQDTINISLEQTLSFDTPCLGQNLISEEKHKDLIENYFLMYPDEALKRGIAFSKDQVISYPHMLNEYAPSTLTMPITKEPIFLKQLLDKRILDIVEGYFGFKPVLKEAYVRRNFPAKYKVMNHFWHRDSNSDFLLKAFYFFTDCKINNGPHHFIKGSVNSELFRDKNYYSDEEITNYPEYNKNVEITTVKAGTLIIEDTRGLHKAGVPTDGYRDLGYAIFTPKYNSFKSLLRNNNALYETNNEHRKLLTQRQSSYLTL